MATQSDKEGNLFCVLACYFRGVFLSSEKNQPVSPNKVFFLAPKSAFVQTELSSFFALFSWETFEIHVLPLETLPFFVV